MKIVLGQKLGDRKCPYMVRWVFQTKWFSVRLHHWLFGDDPRAMHDHGWNFIVIVLRGSYWDITEDDRQLMKPGMVQYRHAQHKHTVDTTGCWTLVITGPVIRQWGFWVQNKSNRRKVWLRAKRYFIKHGHHQCQ